MIGLADCNNFFVSCERTLDPGLAGRAVVVLSNNDGCVVARSNEAKKLGIRMGQPAFEIRQEIASGAVIAMSGNHLLYRAISIRIHDIFRRFVPEAIDYSVDEAFLNMEGIPESNLAEIGEAIWCTCMEEEHIPVTIGFASTKTLAKVATEVGKKWGERVMILSDPKEIELILDKLPIGELWGMGRRLTKRMYMDGVYTIGDFSRRDRSWVRGHLGVVGERSWRELHGESCIEMTHLERDLQDSISETRTFPVDIDDPDYLRSRIVMFSAHVGKRLRAMGGECRRVTVFLRSNRFRTDRGYQAPEASAQFRTPVSDTGVIASAASQLLDQIYTSGCSYKRGGVVLTEITRAGTIAPTLFDEVDELCEYRRRSGRLMAAIDDINKIPGSDVIKLATEITKGRIGHNNGYSSSFGPAK